VGHGSGSSHFCGEFVKLYSEVVESVDKVSAKGVIEDILGQLNLFVEVFSIEKGEDRNVHGGIWGEFEGWLRPPILKEIFL